MLYVSAEESEQQVQLRWQRLAGGASELQLLAETDLELVLEELEALRPAVAIIDSIQALHDANLTSAPGSVEIGRAKPPHHSHRRWSNLGNSNQRRRMKRRSNHPS